jgi:DNA-binding NtrC family response regulator
VVGHLRGGDDELGAGRPGADDPDPLAMVRRVATTVKLPGLAQSWEHLPSLVRDVLAEQPEPESKTRLAPPVWDRLMSWHWPGNLAELHHTVVLLARRANGGIVELDNLSEEFRTPGERWACWSQPSGRPVRPPPPRRRVGGVASRPDRPPESR